MAQDIKRIVRKIQDLPTLPQVAVAIYNLIQDPHSSARDVERVMSRDPALAGKVLRLVNSAYYGFPHKISDLGHAIVILGFSTVRSVALSMSIIDLFPRGDKSGGSDFDRERFWRHCVAAAHVARAGAMKTRKADPEVAFVTGLLHDIGILVIDQYAPGDMGVVLARASADQSSFHAAEKALGKITHAEVGGLLVENWRLAEDIVDAVRYHHEPEEAQGSTYAALVTLADSLTWEAGMTTSGEWTPQPLDGHSREVLGLSDQDVAGLHERLQADRESIDLFLQATG